MKPRWVTGTARSGSVLLIIGLVLALVALTPPAPTGYTSSGGALLAPGKYHANPFTRVYSPLAGLRVTVTSNDSLEIYLIETDYQAFTQWADSWTRDRFPELDENQLMLSIHNTSVLEAYREAEPGLVLKNEDIPEEFTDDYFPQSPVNITVFCSNPSSRWVDLDLNIAGISGLVPGERVIFPTMLLIIAGMMLTLPWIAGKVRL